MLGAEKLFVLPDGPARYDCQPADSLAAHAARRGVSPVEAFLALADESNGLVNLNMPLLNQRLEAVEEMLDDRLVTLGLADAGAHVGQIMDTSQPTFLLTYWVRERQRWSLEEAVRRLTSDTAGLFGFTDRGVLRAGAYADVNVIDFDNLTLPQPAVRARPPQRRRPLHPGRQRLRLHDRQRRGLHGPRRAHRPARRPRGPLDRADHPACRRLSRAATRASAR